MEIKPDIWIQEWSKLLTLASSYNDHIKIECYTKYVTDFKYPHNPLSLAITSNNDALIHMVIRTLILFSKLIHKDIAEILIKHGCPISRIITDIDVNTEIVELLIKREVDIRECVNKKDSCGNTILHKAVRDERLNLVKMLCKDADVNVVNNDNWTPLHYALKKKHSRKLNQSDKRTYQKKTKIAWILLESGADTKIRDNVGMSAWDFLSETLIFNFYADYKNTSNIVSFFYGCSEPKYELCLMYTFHGNARKAYIVCLLDPLKCILRQLVKMESVGTRRFKFTWLVEREFETCLEDCKTELENMKHEILSEDITLYNVLTVDFDILFCYIHNDDVYKALQSIDIKEKYPEYTEDLKCRLSIAYERRKLMKSVRIFI